MAIINQSPTDVISGVIAPEGSVAAPIGTMYIQMTGGTVATVFQKIAQAIANVSDAIGWAQITPAIYNAQGGIFGTGIDGNLVFDGVSAVLGVSPVAGVYAMPVDINAISCTIVGGVTVQMLRFRMFAQGLLLNDGTVDASGGNGTGLGAAVAGAAPGGIAMGGASNTNRLLSVPGAGAGGAVGGTGTLGGNGSVMPFTTVITGGTGGAGVANGLGNNGGTPAGFYAGGGAGGGSGGGAGGNGGAGAATQALPPSYGKPQFSEILRGQSLPAAGSNAFNFWGGGGGGGSTAFQGGGAGGGAGGAQLIVMGATVGGGGVFRTKGGNGGNGNHTVAVGGANGGAGGGGGGMLTVGFNQMYGTWGTDVTGGTGGTGGTNGGNVGGNGGNGGSGRAFVYPLSGT
jgi:hypothetical protein